MKRKHEAVDPDKIDSTSLSAKRAVLDDDAAKARFRQGLFDDSVFDGFKGQYAESSPYPHGVINNLIDDPLLRAVRAEIRDHLSFTLKETDIYKIFQSGDLANLDGLPASELAKLPSLLKLRDALYSSAFRKYIAGVAGLEDGGKSLSGVRTDMAINVYTRGCHLLCHDDVIGTRRLSYILYLTDPDVPWQSEWGGALRLYPVEKATVPQGRDQPAKSQSTPNPEFSKSIPPAWNQLSFFEVRPGQSFHDVEEVFHDGPVGDGDGGRVRMAISGWYHIPQEGEEGYDPDLEHRLAELSSLRELEKGSSDSTFELPRQEVLNSYLSVSTKNRADRTTALAEQQLSTEDFNFLLRFIDPKYLVRDNMEAMGEMFESESTLSVKQILNDAFAEDLRQHIIRKEAKGDAYHPLSANDLLLTEKQLPLQDWLMARPPHKRKFLFKHSRPSQAEPSNDLDPLERLLDEYLPSFPFRKWLSVVTGDLELATQGQLLARRFRKGQDYELATPWDAGDMRLEFTIGLTPTDGWGEDDDAEDDDDSDDEAPELVANGEKEIAKPAQELADGDTENIGGYEVYMAGDELDDENQDSHEGPGDDQQAYDKSTASGSHTGAGHRRTAPARKSNPEVYISGRSADKSGDADGAIYHDGDGDDGVLLSTPAGFNTMTIVLRDQGVHRFVKYVSRGAKGDRWDITGELAVRTDEDDEQGSDIS